MRVQILCTVTNYFMSTVPGYQATPWLAWSRSTWTPLSPILLCTALGLLTDSCAVLTATRLLVSQISIHSSIFVPYRHLTTSFWMHNTSSHSGAQHPRWSSASHWQLDHLWGLLSYKLHSKFYLDWTVSHWNLRIIVLSFSHNFLQLMMFSRWTGLLPRPCLILLAVCTHILPMWRESTSCCFPWVWRWTRTLSPARTILSNPRALPWWNWSIKLLGALRLKHNCCAVICKNYRLGFCF